MPLARRALLLAAPLLATPALAQGVAGRLDGVLAAASALPRLQALIVAQSGAVLLERSFRGPGLDRVTNVKSASKSVLSALVGIAVARGVLRGLDQPVAPILGRRVPAEADPRVREITIGHLLSMQAGLDRTSGANYGAWVGSRDWVRYVLTRPMVEEPGVAMLYSTGSSHLLSVALTLASGRSTAELARDWLAEPLGIAIPPWSRDPQGFLFGGNDMALSPRGLLRFGEAYRNEGRAGGRQVVPAAWVRDSWTPRARSPWSGQLYGLGWWIARAGGQAVYFAWGYGGQMLYVVPGLALTVVATSLPDGPRAREHTAALHALLAEGIIPALGGAAGPDSLAAPPGEAEG